ncbi:MAG: hypothetical protein MSL09_09660 [Spirochaetia bacterium]|nr:hypothetical protein [Spirochaetia bacterium]
MKWLFRIAIVAAIILGGLYFIGRSMGSGLIISAVKDGYFSDVTYDVTIGEILDVVSDKGEWIYEIPNEEEYSMANIVRYKGTYNGQPMELNFIVFSGNPRLDYFRLGDNVINRADNLFVPTESEIDAVPFALYQIYLEKKK